MDLASDRGQLPLPLREVALKADLFMAQFLGELGLPLDGALKVLDLLLGGAQLVSE